METHKNGEQPTYWISLDNKIEQISFEYIQNLSKRNASFNTIKRYSHSISYMLNYLSENDKTLSSIGSMEYMEQVDLFRGFLNWMKRCKHRTVKTNKGIKNKTCNSALKDFFEFYNYLVQYKNYEELKVLRLKTSVFTNSVGLRREIQSYVFDYNLDEKEDEEYYAHILTKEEKDKIFDNLKNKRDLVMVAIMLDTGVRSGELLGIRHEDINLDRRTITVRFRKDNENGARAKRGKNRIVVFSKETLKLIIDYKNKYKSLLDKSTMFFIKTQGKKKGSGMEKQDLDSVLRRLENKTGLHIYSHLLRHTFANEREYAKWDLVEISHALGHSSVITTEGYLDRGNARSEINQREYFDYQEEDIDIEFLIS